MMMPDVYYRRLEGGERVVCRPSEGLPNPAVTRTPKGFLEMLKSHCLDVTWS